MRDCNDCYGLMFFASMVKIHRRRVLSTIDKFQNDASQISMKTICVQRRFYFVHPSEIVVETVLSITPNYCGNCKLVNKMGDENNTEEQAKSQRNKETESTCKIYVKPPHEIMKPPPSLKSTNDDVLRAILKEMPDEELQEFLNEEEFMEGLDVVDAWEGDEDKNREAEHLPADSMEQQEKPESRKRLVARAVNDGESNYRERHQRPAREHKGSKDTKEREKPKKEKEEKKREDSQRRDPAKSTKDIERDKIRTKRDTESKLLAEKEKAIKHLLDSDNVVPPGTEVEAIQSIAERQNLERAQQRERRSRERRRSVDRYERRASPPRRKSPDRINRSSPHRRISPERRRSPFGRMSAERHRSPLGYSPGGKRRNSPRYVSDRRSPSLSSPERRRSPRRLSWERRSSADRRWSTERHRRRDMHERRRSRSRDRRSRSTEHPRRRSSRSPMNRRYSPRRRSRTRSRSPEKRPRKRSPFINELARQLRDESLKPPSGGNANSNSAGGYSATPMLNVPYQSDTADTGRQVLGGPVYMHQPGPRPPLQPPPQPPPPPPPPPQSSSVMPGFINFEMPVVPMTFEMPITPQTLPPADYSSGPVMYNQSNAVSVPAPPPPPGVHPPLHPASASPPEPVPAPMDHGQLPYNPSLMSSAQQPIHQFENKPSIAALAAAASLQSYEQKSSYNNAPYHHQLHDQRLKTPEPPVISKSKQFEKTSLSSLLEASVSAKAANPSNIPVLYPGFNPEIMRNCEQALCQLPYEDPRLMMKGRFFYVRDEEETKYETEDHGSNSILLQKSKTAIYWDNQENPEQLMPAACVKPTTNTHQKICQTDRVVTETKGVQVSVVMVDSGSQVYPHDIQQANREERRPIMDRLDWGMRETYDYAASKFREDDLRVHLSNSSQRRSWNRQVSPSRRSETIDHEHRSDPVDHGSRNVRMDSPFKNRDNYQGHRVRDHYGRYSPEYHGRSMERDDYHERRSEHSRGESPMELEDSDENHRVDDDDDDLVTGYAFQREPEWHGRGRAMRGKGHIYRGKHSGGRPYRSRGGYRGKF
ncbi:PREDICTED: bromodomain-containing protein 4-like isoform X2 [Dinoponera quadriceps]|uniref:Bromodomain-containing protein 4-like isoform X2 n=1 Tax=Dinoponera quadriceps TaxID=609295 RepID=A0A6P3XJP2_DINQU|nr:PREDICTED: bromodomain-containing protein 4-like isoform X2 [Dinoponera quadriceps]